MVGETGRRARQAVGELAGDERFDRFEINARDFLSARDRGGTTGTRIEQSSAALSDAAEILNQSFPGQSSSGQYINAIAPVVIPNRQSLFWRLLPLSLLVVFVLLGVAATVAIGTLPGGAGGLAFALFGPHLWLLLVVFAVFSYLRQSVVMVPDGCRAVITRFRRLEVVGGRRTPVSAPRTRNPGSPSPKTTTGTTRQPNTTIPPPSCPSTAASSPSAARHPPSPRARTRPSPPRATGSPTFAKRPAAASSSPSTSATTPANSPPTRHRPADASFSPRIRTVKGSF